MNIAAFKNITAWLLIFADIPILDSLLTYQRSKDQGRAQADNVG